MNVLENFQNRLGLGSFNSGAKNLQTLYLARLILTGTKGFTPEQITSTNRARFEAVVDGAKADGDGPDSY